jgi:tungstate transport system ATP-binding protein
MLYEIKKLTKAYGDRTVLDLSLSLENGKIIGLLGPNGSGKTTLLELLAFLSIPSSGEVWYKERRVDFDKTDMIKLRRTVVLVQQVPMLFTTTVNRNVEYPLKLRGVEKKKRERISQELLSLVGMEAFMHAKAHRLSGGETQRVAIAQALACNPEAILLDEPTASVDMENQIIIERIIRDINRQKEISIILTTHDNLQASRLSDDIVYLRDGRISEQEYENYFSGHIGESSSGKRVCIIQEGVKIPVKTEKRGRVRISVDPNAIGITGLEQDGDLDHLIKGRLVQLTDEKEHTRALVDIGIPIGIRILKKQIKATHAEVGGNVWISIDPEKVTIF